jgi:exosortase/archaeosortase family protein
VEPEKKVILRNKPRQLNFSFYRGHGSLFNSLFFKLKDVITFMVITVAIHFIWRYWEYQLEYIPVKTTIHSLSHVLVKDVCLQTFRTLRLLIGERSSLFGSTILLGHSGSLKVFDGCSGLKQYAQFALLILIWKGPFLMKCLYIPAGIMVIHIINIIRMIGLSLIIVYKPHFWHAGHDIFFKALFYVAIFGLWVLWVESVAATSFDRE